MLLSCYLSCSCSSISFSFFAGCYSLHCYGLITALHENLNIYMIFTCVISHSELFTFIYSVQIDITAGRVMGSEMEPTSGNAEKRLNLIPKRKRNIFISEMNFQAARQEKTFYFLLFIFLTIKYTKKFLI